MKKEINNVAAIYVRVSTDKTAQKDSPEHQKGICEEKAEVEGLNVQYIYEDRSSGTSIYGREDMKKLMNDAKQGLFDTILFASLSRFARNLKDALTLREFFVDYLGIRLIAIDENYDSFLDKNNAFKFELHGMMNENLSKSISLSSKRGIRESAKRGNFTGSHAPFGYRKVTHKINNVEIKTLEVIEDKAEIVRQIFNLYVNHGMGEKQITNHLNEENIKSPKGGVWGITTIQRILQNEAYCGVNVYRKYKVKVAYGNTETLEDRKKKLVQRDKEKWERNEEKNWDSIVQSEVFKKAQELRLMRGGGKRGGIRNVKANPFAGLVKCTHCGNSMVSMKSGKIGKNGQEYRYLICSTRRRIGIKGCKNGLWIPLEEFKEGVLNELKSNLEKLINVDEVSANVELPSKNAKKVREKKQKELETQLKQNRMLLMNLRKELNLGDKIDLEQYEFEKKEYENEIEVIQESLKRFKDVSKDLENDKIIMKRLKKGLQQLLKLNYPTVDELQLILKQLVDEINVNNDGEVSIITPLGIL